MINPMEYSNSLNMRQANFFLKTSLAQPLASFW